MKQILFLIFLQACMFLSWGQATNSKAQADEMKQMIAELKKEIATLEAEIKKAEKDDPDGVATMKSQLSSYRTMLAAFDKSNPAAAAKEAKPPVTKKPLAQTPSPIMAVHLKQPVVPPTAAQAKDRLFWYRGKKVNDSTLVTKKGAVVQYSHKRHQLIVKPEEKKDSFLSRAKEIARGEQRKRELVDKFDKTKNGFIYYPFITGSLAVYDDLTIRFSNAVNNTIPFEAERPSIAFHPPAMRQSALSGKGAAFVSDDMPVVSSEERTKEDGPVMKWVLQQLEDAHKEYQRLPPVSAFSAPPPHDLSRCASCDTSAISRQRKLDMKWAEEYEGREAAIMKKALSAMREHALLVGDESADLVDEKFRTLVDLLTKHLAEKDRILLDRYGENLQYLKTIFPVLLGHERQKQLLGFDDGVSGDLTSAIAIKVKKAYWKYFNEQVASKNHDFVLNIPFHLGYFRQMALLGNEDDNGNIGDFMNRIFSYNRFALTMDLDFIWQSGADGDVFLRATGKLETPEKFYVMLIPDSCSFKMMAYTTDLSNKKAEDITLPLKVVGGVKTMPDEDGKLKDYPYSGAPQYALRFPDAKIDFCSGGQDTMFLAIFSGDEVVAARAASDMQQIRKTYTIEMLMYAGQVLMNENMEELEQGTTEAGTQIMNTIAGFMQQGSPETTLDKLRIQYSGYMDIDNLRKDFEGSYSTQTAKILFNANNRSTVLADAYIDTKRTMSEGVEVKKGMFHLRIVHEPLNK
ncbi:MAG TPA: hypothetical protein VFR58_07575 [Flavisolibacter sp.]|nr:hypothetical protein [Flavisolibacter sp.]